MPEGTLGPANRSEAASQSPSMARIKYRLWRPVQAGMLWEQWMEQIPLPSQCSPDLDLCRREAFSALFTGDFVFFLLSCRETILDEHNQSHLQFTLLNSHIW